MAALVRTAASLRLYSFLFGPFGSRLLSDADDATDDEESREYDRSQCDDRLLWIDNSCTVPIAHMYRELLDGSDKLQGLFHPPFCRSLYTGIGRAGLSAIFAWKIPLVNSYSFRNGSTLSFALENVCGREPIGGNEL